MRCESASRPTLFTPPNTTPLPTCAAFSSLSARSAPLAPSLPMAHLKGHTGHTPHSNQPVPPSPACPPGPPPLSLPAAATCCAPAPPARSAPPTRCAAWPLCGKVLEECARSVNEKQVAWCGVVLGHGDCNTAPLCLFLLLLAFTLSRPHAATKAQHINQSTTHQPKHHSSTKVPHINQSTTHQPKLHTSTKGTNQALTHLQGSHDVACLVALAVGQQADDVVLFGLLGVLATRHGNVPQRLSGNEGGDGEIKGIS